MILVFIVNFKRDAAQNLGHVHPFGAYSEIFLKYVRIAYAACNTHCHSADIDIRFVFHPADGNRRLGKSQYFFAYIRGNFGVVNVAYLFSVYGKCGKPFLCIRCHYRGKVYGSRALRSV